MTDPIKCSLCDRNGFILRNGVPFCGSCYMATEGSPSPALVGAPGKPVMPPRAANAPGRGKRGRGPDLKPSRLHKSGQAAKRSQRDAAEPFAAQQESNVRPPQQAAPGVPEPGALVGCGHETRPRRRGECQIVNPMRIQASETPTPAVDRVDPWDMREKYRPDCMSIEGMGARQKNAEEAE